MAQYNAGNAYLQILPSFRGIERLMQRETAKLAAQIDRSMAQGANEGLVNAFKNVDTDRLVRSARETGDKWANQFERQITRELKDLGDSLPTFEPKADLDKFDKAIADTRKEIIELSKTKLSPTDGGGGLDELGRKLDDITARFTRMSDEAADAGRKVQLRDVARQAEMIRSLAADAEANGRDSGRRFGGAFAARAQQTITSVLRDLPEFEVNADTSVAERKLAEVRQRLVDLGDKKVGIDIDQEDFARELALITGRLESLTRNPRIVEMKFDMDSALEQLRDFNTKVGSTLIEQQTELGRRSGDQWAGAYASQVQKQLRAAATAIPDVPVKLDDSDAQRKISAIRAQLLDLSDKTVGVDIDAATATAQIGIIRRLLEDLDNDKVTVDIRTNAATAAAEIALIKGQTDDAGVSMQKLGQDAGITVSRLGYLIAIGASLGSLIAPAAAAAAVGIAGIGTAAAAALSGVGVFTLGLYGIGDAVSKIAKYNDDADQSSKAFQQSAERMADATDSVSDAERNLSYARQDAADAAVDASRRISDAQRNVAKVQRDVAEAIREARDRERDAIEDVAKARVDARESIKSATEAEEDAERSATRAIKDQKEAREELSTALKDAVRDLRELRLNVKQNANDIDQATTAAMKAKQELDKIMSNPRATEIERRTALETYQEKVLQIEDLKIKQEELAEQQADADKNGIESTDRVKKAREQVANADERAADAARRLDDARTAADKARADAADKIAKAEERVRKAHEATAKAQSDGAERIADAQRQVADAQRAAARQQEQSQRQILNATEAVTRAQRNLQQASVNAGVAGGDAFDSMRDSLNNLSPAGRAFALWLYSLKPELDRIRRSAQEGLLPGLQDSLQILVDNYFPAFDRFVSRIATGLGNMFRATSQILITPQWRAFFQFLDQEALPSLQGMWVASLNLARGIANIIRALSPLSKPIGSGLVELTEKFARWSDQLQSSTGFQKFTEYAARVGPKVVELIEQLVTFVGRLVIAMAPMGEMILDAVTAVFQWINSWDIGTLSSVVDIIAVLAAGIVLLTGFVRTVKFVTEVWNAVTLIGAKAQQIMAAALARYNAATVTATASTGLLNGRLFTMQASGAAGAAGLGALEAAAGPLGIALAVLGGIFFLTSIKSQNAEKDTDELAGALEQLGEEYRKAANAAQLGSSAVEDSFRKIVAQNEDLQRAVVNLTNLGLGIDQIAAAAGGNADDLDAVLERINNQIATLLKTAAEADNAFDENGVDVDALLAQAKALGAIRDRLQEAADKAHLSNEAMTILNSSTQANTESTQILTPSEKALAEAQKVLADSASTAQEKIDALTKAQDTMRQATIDAIEADESFNSGLITLRESVNAAKAAKDKDSTSLAMNTSQGLRNRDMLENLIQSADKMYDADVNLNGVTAEAVKKGQDHYNQIRNVAKQLGLNKAETDKLIGAYGKIPKNVETAIGFKEGQFDKMFEQLEMAAFIQKGLKEGKDIDKVKQEYKQMISDRNRAKAHGWATGGPIAGAGIVGGKTDDANLIWASKGEFMQQASAVDYYGTGVMHAINNKLIPRELFPGYAGGGSVLGGTQKWPFQVDLKDVWVPSDEELTGFLFGEGAAGALGNIVGGRGWQWQMAALHRIFPKLALISGFRPNAHTLSGNLSWHARGRAVDVPAIRKVAEYIYNTYGKSTLELITPWRDMMLYKGKPHKFSHAIEAQHGVFGNNAHIHWAYDDGGMLPPGYSTVFNGTGKPEPVLTGQQWDAIATMARNASVGAGNVYQFQFRDTTLDPSYLAAMQAREAIKAREGRHR